LYREWDKSGVHKVLNSAGRYDDKRAVLLEKLKKAEG